MEATLSLVRSLMLLGMLMAGAPAVAGSLQVPLEIGAGPVTYSWLGPVGSDQPVHAGLVLTLDVVLDRPWLREHQDQVPARWRALARQVDEVRIRPLAYLPESLIVSPRFADTGMIGASWRPVSVGVPLVTSPVRVGVDAGARLTAAYVWTQTLPTPEAPKNTFFLRPGLDLGVDAVVPISDTIRIRAGLDAQAYLPQKIGGFGLGAPGERMWFVVRGLVELRVRVPHTIKR